MVKDCGKKKKVVLYTIGLVSFLSLEYPTCIYIIRILDKAIRNGSEPELVIIGYWATVIINNVSWMAH